MRCERNWLYTHAFPRLKSFCAGLGLDFQVLDMRWGVTDDATNEHITETLCLQEVRNCQKMSLGPNFVVSIYRQISNISCTKFQNLNVSCLVLQLYLPNPLKPDVKSRMKMQLEQRRQAVLQPHLSDQQFYCC